MSTSKQTMTQVRDILRKLDRSIDDARAKRLSHTRTGQPNRASAPVATGYSPSNNGDLGRARHDDLD